MLSAALVLGLLPSFAVAQLLTTDAKCVSGYEWVRRFYNGYGLGSKISAGRCSAPYPRVHATSLQNLQECVLVVVRASLPICKCSV